MHTIIVDNGTKHLHQLVSLIGVKDVTIVTRDEFRAADVPAGTLVVLSGARRGMPSVLQADGFYDEQIQLIKSHEGPIIGVCMGMELIARAYGEHIHIRKRRIRRLVRVNRTSVEEALFLPERFMVFVAHRYALKDVTGTQLLALAHSRGGIEVIRHTSRPVYGLQFHPEVRLNRNDGARVFGAIMKNIAE